MFVDAGQFYLLAVTPSSQCTESLLNLFTFVFFAFQVKGLQAEVDYTYTQRFTPKIVRISVKLATKDFPPSRGSTTT